MKPIQPASIVLVVSDCDPGSACEKEVLALTEHLGLKVEYFSRLDELPIFASPEDSRQFLVRIHWSIFARHMLGNLADVRQHLLRRHKIDPSQVQAFGTRFATCHSNPGVARIQATA